MIVKLAEVRDGIAHPSFDARADFCRVAQSASAGYRLIGSQPE